MDSVHSGAFPRKMVSNKLSLLTPLRVAQGPTGTPYEGGNFQICIRVPEQYPLTPPVAKFVTKVTARNHFRQRPSLTPSCARAWA